MAKVQSRRTVSLSRESHEHLVAICRAFRIPCSQAIEQAIEAIRDGRVVLAPARSRAEIVALTIERRMLDLEAALRVLPEVNVA